MYNELNIGVSASPRRRTPNPHERRDVDHGLTPRSICEFPPGRYMMLRDLDRGCATSRAASLRADAPHEVIV